jgi:hypothetical protein
MMKHARMPKVGWVVLLSGLIISHMIAIYRLSVHWTWAVGLGLILLVLLKHVGLFGSIHVLCKRRSRGSL